MSCRRGYTNHNVNIVSCGKYILNNTLICHFSLRNFNCRCLCSIGVDSPVTNPGSFIIPYPLATRRASKEHHCQVLDFPLQPFRFTQRPALDDWVFLRHGYQQGTAGGSHDRLPTCCLPLCLQLHEKPFSLWPAHKQQPVWTIRCWPAERDGCSL